MYCPNCGTELPNDAIFCTECGHKFQAVDQQSSIPPPTNAANPQTITETVVEPVTSAATQVPGTTGINTANLGNKAGLIGAILVFIGFFMPWIDFFVSVSGFNMVFSAMGTELGEARFLLLILPLASGIFLLLLFNSKADKGFLNFLKIVPLIFIIISAIVIYSKLSEGRDFGRGPSADFFQIFGAGFWCTLIGSIVMAFHKNKQN